MGGSSRRTPAERPSTLLCPRLFGGSRAESTGPGAGPGHRPGPICWNRGPGSVPDSHRGVCALSIYQIIAMSRYTTIRCHDHRNHAHY